MELSKGLLGDGTDCVCLRKLSHTQPANSSNSRSDCVAGNILFVAHTNTVKSFHQFPHLPYFAQG